MSSIVCVRSGELSKQHLMKLGTGACMSLRRRRRRRGRRQGGQTSPEALVFKHDEKVARSVKLSIFLKLHVIIVTPTNSGHAYMHKSDYE